VIFLVPKFNPITSAKIDEREQRCTDGANEIRNKKKLDEREQGCKSATKKSHSN
jgi:hypothetical protein